MAFLFWLFWTVDLLITLVAFWGKGFRSSFGASTDGNAWIIAGLVLVLGGSLLLRFAFKLRILSLILAALPLIIGGIMYLIDTGKQSV